MTRLSTRLSGGRATRAELYATAAALLVVAAGGVSYGAVTSSSPGTTKTVASDSSTTSEASGLLTPTGADTTSSTAAEPVTSTTSPTPTKSAAGVPFVSSPPPPPPVVPTESPQRLGPGTADLVFSGLFSGQLLGAVSYCEPGTGLEMSQVTVNGTLNGTPWVVFVDSYDGETGVWQVLTGPAGGGTGLVGQGYGVAEDHPQTVPGVTVDWAHGATLAAVQLPSRSGTEPPGTLQVDGTVSCG